jgi:DNA repair exonuclease SbcCD nuclease subunit
MFMIVFGDIHCKYAEFLNIIKQFPKSPTNYIQVGDFGVGFFDLSNDNSQFKYDLICLRDTLRLTNSKLYVIRGNHDNPAYFRPSSPQAEEFRNIFEDIILLVPDYTKLVLDGKVCYFVGGAVSIDRVYRLANRKHYWSDECVLYRIPSEDLSDVDCVFTHTAPSIFYPEPLDITKLGIVKQFNPNSTGNFPLLISDLSEERLYMDKLLRKFHNASKWYYGHFHMSRSFHFGELQVTLLNELEYAKC